MTGRSYHVCNFLQTYLLYFKRFLDGTVIRCKPIGKKQKSSWFDKLKNLRLGTVVLFSGISGSGVRNKFQPSWNFTRSHSASCTFAYFRLAALRIRCAGCITSAFYILSGHFAYLKNFIISWQPAGDFYFQFRLTLSA